VVASAEAGSQQPDAEAAPLGAGRLRQFVAYARKVLGLDRLLGGIRDRRKKARVPVLVVVRILFFLGVLRIRSFNALEPKLAERWMRRALGVDTITAKRLCSVDTLAYALQRAQVPTTRQAVVELIRQTERNKVFREGWHGALRVVALDGWEPFSSYERHCKACLTRQVRFTAPDGTEYERTLYYHVFVVAMLIDEKLDMVLDMEPIRSADVCAEAGKRGEVGHEGELTAALRLVPRLRSTYGRWIDALVADALYACGPFWTLAEKNHFGTVVVLKNEKHEPLKEALALWRGKSPDTVIDDDAKGEHIELWDCPGVRTLDTYDGEIRVVRGVVTEKRTSIVHTWTLGTTGCAARARLAAQPVLAIGRGRWHIENTAFHQFTHLWRFGHVFAHGPEAVPALFWIFILAFNAMQLFLYRQLRCYGRDRGKDVTRTISRLIDEMLDDLARLDAPIVWDTS
jgi:hypothetical protein